MAFTDSTTVKAHLGITGTSFDTVLANLIGQVDDLITKETGVLTGAASANLDVADEIRDSDGTLTLRTKYHPINSITQVEKRDSNNDWEDYTEEAVADIEFDGNRIFTRYVVAAEGRRQVRLTYNAGYVSANVPDDLKLAATLWVASIFSKRQSLGFKSQSQLSMTVLPEEDRPFEITKILKKYRPVYAF